MCYDVGYVHIWKGNFNAWSWKSNFMSSEDNVSFLPCPGIGLMFDKSGPCLPRVFFPKHRCFFLQIGTHKKGLLNPNLRCDTDVIPQQITSTSAACKQPLFRFHTESMLFTFANFTQSKNTNFAWPITFCLLPWVNKKSSANSEMSVVFAGGMWRQATNMGKNCIWNFATCLWTLSMFATCMAQYDANPVVWAILVLRRSFYQTRCCMPLVSHSLTHS